MSDVKPAMTPEEWAEWVARGGIRLLKVHQIAAKHLHDQPFGFTWEHVKLLDDVNEHELGCAIEGGDWPCDCPSAARRRDLDELSDIIEALLPPDEA